MKTILLATHNYGKCKEIEDVLLDTPYKFTNLKELGIHEDVEETGKTYKENAIIKAQFFSKLTKLPCIADDSGIQVEALKGELGIHTRRWGVGAAATDEEWIDHFLKVMENHNNRKAEFQTVLAYFDTKNNKPYIFKGTCKGTLSKTIEAQYLPGIPISAIFKPIGYKKVYSDLSIEEKNAISHRGKASMELRKFLTK